MIIAPHDFRDEEYFVPRSVFEKEGFVVKTASTKKGIAFGVFGGEVEVDLLPEEVKIKDFDAFVFVGGPGALKHLDNSTFYKMIKEVVGSSAVLGAVCVSPIILANAGILEGKQATVWSSTMDKKAVSLLKEKGGLYREEEVVCDGNLVTANGPEAAKKFAQEIVSKLR